MANPKYCDARSIARVFALCAVLTGRPAWSATQDDQSSVAYAIACRMEVERDAALSPTLIGEVQQRIQQAFSAILGPDQRVRFVHGREAASIPPLTDASVELLGRHWPGPERLLLVSVGRTDNQYVVKAREHDPRFQVLSPVVDSSTMQRELVADIAGRVVLQSFSPTALVRSATGTNVQIEFLGDARLVNYREWLGLSGDVGLQVMRETTQGRTKYRTSFLALRSWQGNRAECELFGPDKLFRDLDSGEATYVVRPVRSVSGMSRIRVLRKESRQPQPDCEVFASLQQYSTDPNVLRGLTDRTGTLAMATGGAGVQFVSVRYEDLVLKAPILPGASADPVVFEIPTRGRRAEFIRPLRQILQEIDDQYLVDMRLREELKTRVEAREVAEVRRLIERGQTRRVNVGDIESRVHEIELRAQAEGEDVREAAAQVRQIATQKASRPLDQVLAAYADWADKFEKKVMIDSFNAKVNDLQEKMDWEGLIPVFEKWIETEPDNQKIAEELRLLKNDLRIKNPDHGRARDFVDDGLKRISTADLASRWADVERETHVLLKARDHLTLMKMRRSLNAWVRDIGQQVKGLVEKVQAAGDDDDRVRELRDQLEQFDELNQSLTKLHQEIQSFLDTLKL